jgi:ParB family chromosome partitioning protein
MGDRGTLGVELEMAKRRSPAELLDAAHSAGVAIQAQDRAAEARVELERSLPAALPLGKILDRISDTRELSLQHITELLESVAVLGLLEPLVVDKRGRMLAGGHRKAAIALLKERMPSAYAQHFPDELIPVRIMNFDAEKDPELALQVEITENEKRRDYTAGEVRALADRLRQEGYVDVKGRPSKGEKALRPALELIIGKSIRTVRRYLNQPDSESRTTVTLSDLENDVTPALRRLRTELIRWQKANPVPQTSEVESVGRDVARLLKRVESSLKKLEV